MNSTSVGAGREELEFSLGALRKVVGINIKDLEKIYVNRHLTWMDSSSGFGKKVVVVRKNSSMICNVQKSQGFCLIPP